MKKYKNCQICGNEFISKSEKHKYCSDGCRKVAQKLNILKAKFVYEIDYILGNVRPPSGD